MTIRIPGNWKKGFAHDIHTLDSVYLGVDEYGYDRWENTRSEMGELLYDLKCHGRSENVEKIVDMLNRYKGIEEMDAIVPVPSSNQIALAGMRYANVTVFCSGPECRNNIGQWNVNYVPVDAKLKGRDFYTQKDKAMAGESDYGFALWDGGSPGSISNVFSRF